MSANKRIPVTEERWEQLHDLKRPGQTYDELIGELIQERNRKELAEKAREMDEMDPEELTPLDEV